MRNRTRSTYRDIITCAQHLLSQPPGSSSFKQTAHDLLNFIDEYAPVKKAVFSFFPPFKENLTPSDFIACAKLELDKPDSSPALRNFIIESAMYAFTIHGTSLLLEERLSFIEQTLHNDPSNIYLHTIYQKTKIALHKVFSAKFALCAHAPQDRLIPVLNYIPKIGRRAKLDMHLEYLAVTHADFVRKVHLPDKLDQKDEAACIDTFFKFIAVYTKLEKWKGTALDNLIATTYLMIRKSSRQNILFIKDKFTRICGKGYSHHYWNTFENASHVNTITHYIEEFLNPAELKEMCDFCMFVLAIIMSYGDGRIMREAIKKKLARLRHKYKNDALLDRIGIFSLPIDFAFADNKGQPEIANEHHALLHMMKTINPNTEIQPLLGSLIWARDNLAWLNENFSASLQSIKSTSIEHMNRGLLSEGGNIVTGKAKRNFVLVSREALNKDLSSACLVMEAKKYNIDVYALPGGFSWARNTGTNEDIILDSIHIDTVINTVPSECTLNGRLKVIIDPYYFQMIEDLAEFKRFTQEQSIEPGDIVLVDKKELYLNLANFSVILDKDNNKKLLFNKEKGLTLPRLNLKPDVVMQPYIEIINLAALNGSIRCVTNMSPKTHIKKGSSVFITIEHTIPQDIEKAITEMFFAKQSLIKTLSTAWVGSVQIRHRFQESFYVYDSLSRMTCITLGYSEGYDADASCRYIETCINQMCQNLIREMGVDEYRLLNYAVTPLSSVPGNFETAHVIKTRTGELLTLVTE